MYKKKNFVKTTLSAPLATAGTSLAIQAGEGSKFPDIGGANVFMGVLWGSAYATPEKDPNREIVEAYRSAGDSFTIIRAQEDTSAKGWVTGDYFILTATARALDEYEIGNAPATVSMDDTDEFGVWDTVLDTLYKITFLNFKIAIGKYLMPVGTIKEFGISTNPATLYGFGTWSLHGVGRTTVCIDAGDVDFDTVGETYGHKEMQLHGHIITYTKAGDPSTVASPFGYISGGNGAKLLPPVGTNFGDINVNILDTGSGDSGNVQPSIVTFRYIRTE